MIKKIKELLGICVEYVNFDFKKTTFAEIPIGDVFAYEGCLEIYCKISKTKAIYLAENWDTAFIKFYDYGINYMFFGFDNVLSISQEAQALWRT